MDLGVYDPNNTGADASAGGKTKVSPTSQDGPSYQGTSGYGFMTNDASMKIQGEAAGTTLPVAGTITPQTYGDPAGSAADFPSR